MSTTKIRTDALFFSSSSSSHNHPSPQPPPANDGNSNNSDDDDEKNPKNNETHKNDTTLPNTTTTSTSNNNDILSHDLHHLSHLIRTKQITCLELMTATLERISKLNPTYNAIVSLRDAKSLLSTARSHDESLTTTTTTTPNVGPLFGIPLAIKDMIDVSGLPTTKGSPLLSLAPPPTVDDIIVSRFKRAGAIIIGKTNVPEFGLGSHSFNALFGTTVNSFDPTKSGGGSSGGAAVAVATRMVAGGDGSDMMGSLRNPAGWNNLYSWRPAVTERVEFGDGGSFGSLSTVGPMGRCPRDLDLMGGIMMGMTTTTTMMAERPDLKGLRIGWLGDWGGDYPMEDGILRLCREALATFENLGCDVVIADDDDVGPSLFPSGRLWDSWTTLRSYHLAKELPHDFDAIKPEATWEIRRGLSLSEDDVTRAIDVADEWSRYCEDVLFREYDVLALPSSQVFAFPCHERYPKMIAGREMDTYHRWMEVMIPVSLAGLPCVTVPVGFSDDDGLSMGMQLFSRKGNDRMVLDVAQGYHLEKNWVRERQPPCL